MVTVIIVTSMPNNHDWVTVQSVIILVRALTVLRELATHIARASPRQQLEDPMIVLQPIIEEVCAKPHELKNT